MRVPKGTEGAVHLTRLPQINPAKEMQVRNLSGTNNR